MTTSRPSSPRPRPGPSGRSRSSTATCSPASPATSGRAPAPTPTTSPSETWIAVARNLPGFTGDEDALRGWVFTIARRRLQDHHRRNGRRREALTDPATIGDADATPGADVTALDDGALGDEAARRLVASLPDLQADVVLLRIVGGLGVDEVASIVGKRPGTVRVLQHRALKRLAREIPPPRVTPEPSRAMKET